MKLSESFQLKILITIQGDSGNDFRPLIPRDNEIYNPGNS